MGPEVSLPCSQRPSTGPYPEPYARTNPSPCVILRNKLVFYGENLLAPRPIQKLEVHPFSAGRDSLSSQLPSLSGGRLLHPQTEAAPCRGDRDSHNMDYPNFALINTHFHYFVTVYEHTITKCHNISVALQFILRKVSVKRRTLASISS